MVEYLNHANCRKVGGIYLFEFRTQEMADLIGRMAKEKGMKVECKVVGVPKYFKTKQDHLKHLLETNTDFKEFYKELGLKLN